jgi:DNA-directed RNA polymerase subunit L
MKVKNVKVTEINFDNKIKNFEKCVEYIKLIDPDYKKFLPKKPIHKVEFELTDTNVDFANCIRRFLLDEINVFSMNVDDNSIITDDKFILSDVLKKNIEMIPFQQELTENECKKLKMTIDITNTSEDIITVYTGDININLEGKELDNEKYFSTNIPLINLRSNTKLSVDVINIVNGYAKQDAGKFCLLSNLSYEIMDVKPLEETKFNKSGSSSLISNPKHFKISYKTHRNIKSKKVMILCCDQIIERMNEILKELNAMNNKMVVHFSDLIELETKDQIKLYHFKNEFWSISNIIARYCYINYTGIKFVCSSIIHPSIEESIVKINHPEANDMMINSVKSIISDISVVKKNFM